MRKFTRIGTIPTFGTNRPATVRKVHVAQPAQKVEKDPNGIIRSSGTIPVTRDTVDIRTTPGKSDIRRQAPKWYKSAEASTTARKGGDEVESDNPLFGLEDDIRALGGHVVTFGTEAIIGMESVDPLRSWTKRNTSDESDITGNPEVLHDVTWTATNAYNPDNRPKVLTKAERQDPDKVRERIQERRNRRKMAELRQNGTLPTDWRKSDTPVNSGPIPTHRMKASIPCPTDTNDATADERGAWDKVTTTVTKQARIGQSFQKWEETDEGLKLLETTSKVVNRTRSDDSDIRLIDAYHGQNGADHLKLPKVLDSVIPDEEAEKGQGWQSLTIYGSRRKGAGRKILTNVSGRVMSEGKWRNRTKYPKVDRPDSHLNGDVLTYKCQFVPVSPLQTFYRASDIDAETGQLVAREALRYTATETPKPLNLDGTNPRFAERAKKATKANQAKAAERRKKKESDKKAKSDILDELQKVADKVHMERNARFRMTQTDRDILDKLS